MSTQMGDFLLKLSQDPFLTDKFKNDPESVLRNFELTPEETALILNRDPVAMDQSFNVLALCSGVIKTKKPKPKKKKATKKKAAVKKK